MNPQLKRAIESAIFDATGSKAEVDSHQSIGGGCISRALKLQLVDGRKFFLKTNSNCPPDMFAREAEGLAAIVVTQTIKVPNVVGSGCETGTHFLLLEYVESAAANNHFFREFGCQLAQLHKSATNQRFGFASSNYIGSTVQRNDWHEHWVCFWREHRLGFQFELARKNGHADREFNRQAESLLNRLDTLLETNERPSLVHGDLWSGNFMTGRQSEPVLIDPAVYFGHREAEFGMTTLFGGFSDDFYRAYDEVWPLEDGADDRIELYRLYHLLNHLNLFGISYRNGCHEIMKKYC